jgi:hypothetical protein
MASVIYISKEGNISGLADNLLDKLTSLGPKKVQRVSHVEFDENLQCWVATDLQGYVIAANAIRSKVIEAEREYLNKKIEEEFARN